MELKEKDATSEERRRTLYSNAPTPVATARDDAGLPLSGVFSEVAMSYSDFSLDELKSRFHLRLDEGRDLFSGIEALDVSDWLKESLARGVPLAFKIGTEKARSELVIAPILLEVLDQSGDDASLFSGVDFPVDPDRGLRGTCDFLFSRSPEQLIVETPVITVVEAKNENMKAGIAQCLAEMVGAHVFNQRRGRDLSAVYGAVTTGSNWKFLKLTGDTAFIDQPEYYLNEVGRIVAILMNMIRDVPA
jgi:hypothetical protein